MEELNEKNIEDIIADNLTELRKSKKLKQSELAEQMGYSDKTVSRWENGSTVPDIATLARLAEFYCITVDDLLHENAVEVASDEAIQQKKEDNRDKLAIMLLGILTVWLIAVVVYAAFQIIKGVKFWQVFVWAVIPSVVLAYRFNINNKNVKWLNTIYLSVAIWGAVTATYLQLLQYNLWPLFLVPIPVEAMIVVYTLFRKPKKRKASRAGCSDFSITDFTGGNEKRFLHKTQKILRKKHAPKRRNALLFLNKKYPEGEWSWHFRAFSFYLIKSSRCKAFARLITSSTMPMIENTRTRTRLTTSDITN